MNAAALHIYGAVWIKNTKSLCMESIMDFFDESVRQRQQSRRDGSGFRLTDDAKSIMLEFAKSSKQATIGNDDKDRLKAFFEECMDDALHGRRSGKPGYLSVSYQ